MLEIKEVKTKKQQKEFINFPLKLYKDNPYFVPPLYVDEMKLFKNSYINIWMIIKFIFQQLL